MKRMPFGLLDATADFSRCYQRILGPTKRCARGLLGVITLVWVDDNVVYSYNTTEHLGDVCKVLQRLAANNMSIKPSKCIWSTTILPFLGQIIMAKRGIQPDTEKIKGMLETKPPECVSLLRTFLGQSVWLSKHVEDYTRLVAPLRNISNKHPSKVKADISHEWISNPEALNSFNAIKVALCAQPLLTFPKFDRPFIVLVDASGGENGGYGACLAQLDDQGHEQPIAYASCALNQAQKGYPITQGESAALMWALRRWRQYTQNSSYPTIVVSDHSACKSLQDPKKIFANRRLANYAAELGDMDVIITHRSGRIHYTADWLTRCIYEEDEEKLEALYSELTGKVAEVAKKVGMRKQHILFDQGVQHV
jgi:hypothetical protein